MNEHEAALRKRKREESEAKKDAPPPPREFKRNAQGGSYAHGVEYAWDIRQRIVDDYDKQDEAAFRSETARYDALSDKWRVSRNTVRKYVNDRSDVLAGFDYGWSVTPAHTSKGAPPQIRVRQRARCASHAPRHRARGLTPLPPARRSWRWTRWSRSCSCSPAKT
jgi:hypothetical protein